MMNLKKRNLKKRMKKRKINKKKIRMMSVNLLLMTYKKEFKNYKKELIKKFLKRSTSQKSFNLEPNE
jgi:hypothetical protein